MQLTLPLPRYPLAIPNFFPPQKSQLHLNAVLPSVERIHHMQLLRRRKHADAFSSRLREGRNDEFHGPVEQTNCTSNVFALIKSPSADTTPPFDNVLC